MNKDEILSKSRKDNKNGDERQLKVREHAYAMSAAWVFAICMILIFFESVIFDRDATIIWVVLAGMEFTNALTGAIQTKSKKYILLTALFTVILIFFFVIYLMNGFNYGR